MAKQERGFRYEKRSKDTLKERANMKGGNFDTIFKPKFKQWKPKDGKNRIRILPPTWKGAKHYGLDIFINYNIGADNQSYLSLDKHDRGPDPLAEARREAQKEGDKEYAKKLQPNQRILYWIIDRNDEEEGPLLWAAPFTFDKALSNLCIDEDTKDVIFIDDPENGRDVRFYKEGTGLTTKYDASKMKVLDEGPVHDDEGQQDEWLDFITDNPLPDVLNFYDYDHIKATFGGEIGSRDDDKASDDDDEKPARGRSRSRSEDDDADEKPARGRRRQAEPEDEDDEPEEKPARGRQRAKPSADDGDDDDDEKSQRRTASRRSRDEPDDDEPEEKPARGRRRVAEPEDEDEPEEKPQRRRARAAEPEDDEGDEDPPSTRRGRSSKDADDDDEGGGNLRQKLAARRRSRNSDDD